MKSYKDQIQVNYIEHLNKSNLLAIATITINRIKLPGFKIVRERGRFYVHPPSQSWFDDDGNQCWRPLVKLNSQLWNKLQRLIIDRYLSDINFGKIKNGYKTEHKQVPQKQRNRQI